MLTVADWVAIGLTAVFIVLGMLFGFGKGLKFFTSGIVGVLISFVICYALGGLIFKLSFVQSALDAFRNVLAKNGSKFCEILLKIQIDLIVYYIALFIVVTILRIVIVIIIKKIVEMDNMFLIILNKTLGVVFFVFVLVVLIFFAFLIMALIKGADASAYSFIENSKLRLDWLYEHNPFMIIVNVIKIRLEVPVTA